MPVFAYYFAYYYSKLIANVNGLFQIRRVVKNWYMVVLFRAGIKKVIIMKLRSGRNVYIDNINAYNEFRESKEILVERINEIKSKGYEINLNEKERIIEIKKFDRNIKFYFDDIKQALNTTGVIKENFVDEQYRNLDVKGKDVVDAGANIGDTAIYFALKGAKHVYAFEPYPYSYRLALKNIDLNGLKDKITIINRGVGKSKDRIKIDPNFHSTAESTLNKFKKGKSIAIITLEDIVNNYLTFRDSAILKVDCEGCEYGVILSTPDNTLQKFNQIMIEYYHGYKNLEAKLRSTGFAVTHRTYTF